MTLDPVVFARESRLWTKSLPDPKMSRRDDLLVDMARDRRILHVGATDAPMTAERIKAGELLHLKLRAVAKQLVGLDSDAASVELLRETTGTDDIVVMDVLEDEPSGWPNQLQGPFDAVFCCDVIEHVDNPGRLLRRLRSLCNPTTDLVITTINALGLKAALRALAGRESVHPDHVAYYSFSTLCELMHRNRLQPVLYGTYSYPTRLRITALLTRGLYSIMPNAADGVMMVGRRCT